MSTKHRNDSAAPTLTNTLQPNEANQRKRIWKDVAQLLPGKQRGDIAAADHLLQHLAEISPSTTSINNSVLLRWLKIIGVKQTSKVKGVARTLQDFKAVAYREEIWKDVAQLLPWKQEGNIVDTVKFLLRLSTLAPSTTRMSNSRLFRRIKLISEKQAVTAEGLALIFEDFETHYTKDGFFITKCWDCNRQICLVPDSDDEGDTVYDIFWRSRRAGHRHQCDNMSNGSQHSIVHSNHHREMIGQSFTDQNDASIGIGHKRRENGRFGSYPSHDKHDDD